MCAGNHAKCATQGGCKVYVVVNHLHVKGNFRLPASRQRCGSFMSQTPSRVKGLTVRILMNRGGIEWQFHDFQNG